MNSGYEVVGDQGEVVRRIRELSAQTIIIDIEPFIASWDSSQQELDQGIARLLDQIRGIPAVRVLCFATNSARLPSTIPEAPPGVQLTYLASARKPARTAPYQAMPRPGVVVGDQIATDGALAWRLHFTFLHLRRDLRSMPTGPRLLSRAGRMLRPVLFPRDLPRAA